MEGGIKSLRADRLEELFKISRPNGATHLKCGKGVQIFVRVKDVGE
jgi:hypothetical protein